jgi:hypothetical protein
MMSSLESNHQYITTSCMTSDKKFAYEHQVTAKSLRSSTHAEPIKWVKWITNKPLATIFSAAFSMVITYGTFLFMMKIMEGLFS